MEPPADSGTQPIGVPGDPALITLRVPPYTGFSGVGVAVTVVVGLVVGVLFGVAAADVGGMVTVDVIGAAVVDCAGVAGVLVAGAGVPQLITTEMQISRMSRVTISFFMVSSLP